MSTTEQLALLPVTERNELESLLMDCDQAWTPESFDVFVKRLQSHPYQPYYEVALAELVKIDMQRSWSDSDGRLLDVYLQRCPNLGTSESVSVALILAEFDARSSVGDNVVLDDYLARFPQQFDELKQLSDVRAKLAIPETQAGSLRHRAEQHTNAASIDTSRIDEVRDTRRGSKKTTPTELPAEFGRYRIIKELGSGAMGTVYLAHDSGLDRQVALKTPSFDGDDDGDSVIRFYREARAAAKIQHRNICPVFDVGQIDDRHFISMAFVKGRCMSEYIKTDSLPAEKTSAILIHRLALALGEAHRHNVIHRDLKPANIMIDGKKEPVVMDFGLARQMDVESRVTQSGMKAGAF